MITIGFIPKEGQTANYEDCTAIDPNGNKWSVVENKWQLYKEPSKHQTQEEDSFFSGLNPLGGWLGFSLGMVFFAHPVALTFGLDGGAGWLILFILCLFTGFVFSKI